MRRSALSAGGLTAIVAGFLSSSAYAQDGGVRMVFGIDNRLEVIRNGDLAVPAEGTRVANVTALSFGFLSETALDRLEFNASGALIVENPEGGGGTDVDFGRSALTFGYRREVPAAVFEIAAQFRTDDVGAFGDDISDTDSEGTQTEYGVSTRLEVGRTAPVGLAFGLAYDVTEYDDTIDPDLVDTTEGRAEVAAILHFSEVLTGRLGLNYRLREEEDLGTTTTETVGATAGLDYAISERLDLGIALGFVRIDTEEFGVTERTEGPDARVTLGYDMPNGSATAELRITTDGDEGERTTFEIGRALELPAATLSARLGFTHSDAAGTDVIGAIDWVRTRPDGSIGLSLARSARFDADDDESIVATVFSLSFDQRVNDRSQISLDLSHAMEQSSSEDIDQTEIGAVYSYELTQDWNLDSGVSYRIRNDADGRAESPTLFVSLNRAFEIRP